MADTLTPKQEKFAQTYVEIGNASEAYRQSYDVGENTKQEVIHVKASELLAHGKVSVRIVQLQEEARERHNVTIDSITAELNEARTHALKDPKGASAAVSAIMGKAKLHGLLIDKSELSGPHGKPIEINNHSNIEKVRRIAFALQSGLEAINDEKPCAQEQLEKDKNNGPI